VETFFSRFLDRLINMLALQCRDNQQTHWLQPMVVVLVVGRVARKHFSIWENISVYNVHFIDWSMHTNVLQTVQGTHASQEGFFDRNLAKSWLNFALSVLIIPMFSENVRL
jgi:hypothetical protein